MFDILYQEIVGLPTMLIIVVAAIVVFTIVNIIILSLIYYFHLKQKKRIRFIEKYTEVYEPIILKALVDGEIPDIVASLKGEVRSNINRVVLVNKFIGLSRSIKGEMLENLCQLYKALELEKKAMKWLKSNKWQIMLSGVRELRAMRIKLPENEIAQLLNSGSKTLSNEVRLSQIHSQGIEGLDFLDDRREPLSEWFQSQILHCIEKEGLTFIPTAKINRWLSSDNATTISVALKMIKHFSLSGHDNKIQELIEYPNKKIQYEARDTLAEIGISKSLQSNFSNQKDIRKGEDLAPAIKRYQAGEEPGSSENKEL